MGRPRGAKGGRAARRGAATPPLAGAKRRASRSRSASPVAKRTRLQELHAKIRDEEEQMGCAGAGGGAGEGEGGTGQAELQLLDLPPELVLTILEFCQPFREVARLRLVCRAFDDICCHIIKSGFVKMQEQVSRRIAQLEQEAADLLAAVTGEGSTITCAARRTLQRNLQRQQHLRLLTFQLQLVRALTWRYVDAAACAPPYALLLDTCAALLYGGERGDVRPRAHVHTCRNVAMVLLKNFLRHVEQGQPAAAAVAAAVAPPLAAGPRFAGAARDRDRDLTAAAAAAYAAADVVLPCACVIDLLEASLASPCPGRNCRITFRPTRSHSVRVQARYDLEGCWLGVYSGSSPHGALHAGDIHLLTSILCDLVCSSSEARLLGLRDPATAGDPNERPHPDADPLKLPGLARGHPPFCVYPRLHNPRQCYRGSIREPSGRVFAFGHAPGERSGLRVFLDLTASVSLVPASLMRRLTPHAPAWPLPPSAAAAAAQLPASASEPFIPKGHAASAAAATVDAHGRCMPFDLELVFESNAERVVYRSYAS